MAPPSSGPAAWLCRYCGHDTTPFGDTVTIVCQARDAPRGCCWHLGCLRGEDERNAARRALMVPHSRWACPSCRVGVVALGPGMGRYDDAHGGFDPGGGVTPRASMTPADQPLPSDAGFHIAVGLGVGAACDSRDVALLVAALLPLPPPLAPAPPLESRCRTCNRKTRLAKVVAARCVGCGAATCATCIGFSTEASVCEALLWACGSCALRAIRLRAGGAASTLHFADPPPDFVRDRLGSTSRPQAASRQLAAAARDPSVLLLPSLVEVAPGGVPPAPPLPGASTILMGDAGFAASAAFRANPGGTGVGQLNYEPLVRAGARMSDRLAALRYSDVCAHCGESAIGLDVRLRGQPPQRLLCGRCHHNLAAAARPRATDAQRRLGVRWTVQNHMAFPSTSSRASWRWPPSR